MKQFQTAYSVLLNLHFQRKDYTRGYKYCLAGGKAHMVLLKNMVD
jgi:hypothetical protein